LQLELLLIEQVMEMIRVQSLIELMFILKARMEGNLEVERMLVQTYRGLHSRSASWGLRRALCIKLETSLRNGLFRVDFVQMSE